MESLLPLLSEVARKYLVALVSPFYLLLIFFIGWQYKRMQQTQLTADLTRHSRQYIRSTLVAVVAGALGGFVGSFLLILFGIDLAGLGLIYLFIVALLLMMIHPRFLCFAYAGGVLSVLSIATGFPRIQVAHVMALVAILHMVESLLILFTGHLNPIPIYSRHPGGQMVGGFNLQKFWPLPLVAMMSAGMVSVPMGVENWWPLLNNGFEIYNGVALSLIPVLAILGYGEVATTSTPRQRSKRSALYLCLFSITLLGLAVLGAHRPAFLILAALFGPLGHELVIALSWRSERCLPPIYVSPLHGLMVLDVVRQSPADLAGLRSRDIITGVNGVQVRSPADLMAAIDSRQGWVTLHILRQGNLMKISLWQRTRDYLGIVPAPEPVGMVGPGNPPFTRFLRILAGRLRDTIVPRSRRH